jgi:uncharacterized protein YecE (DUF72 family)
MLPLKEKTLALLIQLPPSLKITEGIENLRRIYCLNSIIGSDMQEKLEIGYGFKI